MKEEMNSGKQSIGYVNFHEYGAKGFDLPVKSEVVIKDAADEECDATKLNGYSKAGLHKNKNIMYTLITGASSGIGKALALECASRGMNVLLVALPGDDLCTLEKDIRNQFKVKCHSLGVDLSVHCASSTVFNWVKENKYAVNILINNVG